MPLPSESGRIYVIAEMACSHEGDPALARTIIDGAGRGGADGIQFQVWTRKDMVVPHHQDYDLLGRLEMEPETWVDLAAYSRQRYPGMEIIACVYEHASLELCERIGVDGYKIHSADLSNPELILAVAATRRCMDLSLGASTLEEIEQALAWIRRRSQAPVWLMYGYQNFPTRTDDVHLNAMIALRERFGLPVGYQDHSDADAPAAFWLPAAAAAMGAVVLEKHITHDRSKKGIDHQAALNPDEFAAFVKMVRELEAAKGTMAPRSFSSDELKYRRYAKKSIVAGRGLPTGTRIERSDLRFLRAMNLGLPPDAVERLVGRVTRREIAPFELVREEDVS